MMQNIKILSIIRKAIWDEPFAEEIIEFDYDEMKRQAISSLVGSCLSSLNMEDNLLEKWRLSCIQQVSSYARYVYFQDRLPITVPYVVLKGTSAGQYYEHPEYRTMGDIDIMTRREDFYTAYNELLENGFKIVKALNRETCFMKNGFFLELHSFFASLNDPNQAKYLDDMIVENINESHKLPDLVNGLTILEHISQHLEHGLGFRQIIDWMMFVDKCLPDSQWNAFKSITDKTGLIKLAKVITRMCEIYLGLPARKWCDNANEELCAQLMDYIISNGNFGEKRKNDSTISENVLMHARNPIAIARLLQQRGLVNWQTLEKHGFLRKFAWLYQAGRYICKGIHRENAVMKVHAEYKEAQKRKKMFDELGVIQASKGFIVYKDGKYEKE